MRAGGRKPEELRKVRITPNYLKYPEGSVLIEIGDTAVICTASVEDGVPVFLRGRNKGWVTAEYGMLPRSADKRMNRESSIGRVHGRTCEIKRLIGRSLRAVVDFEGWGARTVWMDCDVIQADGGTRTASITGAYTALVLAFNKLKTEGTIDTLPITGMVTAVSAGVVDGEALLDLDFVEDSSAEVDINIVKDHKLDIIEIQGSAEAKPFSEDRMDELLHLADRGITELAEHQKTALDNIDLSYLT